MDNSKEVDVTSSVTESEIVEDEALQNVSDDINLSTHNDGTTSTFTKGDTGVTTPHEVQSESMADNEKLQDELEIFSDPITEEISDHNRIELSEGDSQEWKTEPIMDDQEVEDELETLSESVKEQLNDAAVTELPNVESEKEKSDSVSSCDVFEDAIETLSDPTIDLSNDPTESEVPEMDTDEKTEKEIDDHEILVPNDRVSEDCKEVIDDMELSIAESPLQNVSDGLENSLKSCGEQTSGLTELLDKEEEETLLSMSGKAVEEEKDELEPSISISNETEIMTAEVAEPETLPELDVDLNDKPSEVQGSNVMDHDILEESEAQVDNLILSETEDKPENQTEGALTQEESKTIATGEMESESIVENEIPDNEPKTLSDPLTERINDTNESELLEVAINENLSKVAIDENLSKVAIDENLSKVAIDENLSKVAIDENLSKVTIDENLPKVAIDEKLSKVAIDENLPKVAIDEKLSKVAIDEKLAQAKIDEKLLEVEIVEKLSEVEVDEKFSEVEVGKKLSGVEIGDKLSEVEVSDKLSEVEVCDKLSEVEVGDKLSKVEVCDKLSEVEVGDKLSEVEVGNKLSEVEVGNKLSEVEIGDTLSEVEIGDNLSEVEIDEKLSEVEIGDKLSEVEIGDKLSEVEIGHKLSEVEVDEKLSEVEIDEKLSEVEIDEKLSEVEIDDKLSEVEIDEKLSEVEIDEKLSEVEIDEKLSEVEIDEKLSEVEIDEKLSEVEIDDKLSEVEIDEKLSEVEIDEKLSEVEIDEKLSEVEIDEKLSEVEIDEKLLEVEIDEKLLEVEIDENLSEVEIDENLSEVEIDEKSEKDIEDNENLLPVDVLNEDSKELKTDVELNITQSPATDVLSLLEEIPKSFDEPTSGFTELLDKEAEETLLSMSGEPVEEEKDELEPSMSISNETEIMTVEVSEFAKPESLSELDVDLKDKPSQAQGSNDNMDHDELDESEAQVDNSILSGAEDKPENQTEGALAQEESETIATGEMESESIVEKEIPDNELETLSDPLTEQINDADKSELSEVAIDEKLSKVEIDEKLSEVEIDEKSGRDIEDNENSLPENVLSEDSKELKTDVELNITRSPAMDVLSLLEEIPKACEEQTSESTKLLEKEQEQLSFSIADNDEVCIGDESAALVPESSEKDGSVPSLNDAAEMDKDFEIVADLKCDLLQESDDILAGESSEELTAVDAILIDEFSTSILNENVESLECLDNLEILPDNQVSLIDAPSEELEATVEIDDFSKIIEPSEMITENVDESPVEVSTTTPVISDNSNYVSDVISSSTNVHDEPLTDNLESIDDKGTTCDDFAIENEENLLNMSEDIDYEVTEQRDEGEVKTIEESIVSEGDIEMDLKEDEEKLIEQAVLEACDVKIGLSGNELFDSEETSDLGVASIENADTSQQSSEISELECAVKFLQESEEHGIDSPLLSPKILEDIPDNSRSTKSCLFLSETEVCEDRLVLSTELEEITPDSIAISEAEIISEAAKLENEKKLTLAADMSKLPGSALRLSSSNESTSDSSSGILKNLLAATDSYSEKSAQSTSLGLHVEEPDNQEMQKLSDSIIRRSEKIPKISILEERLKEPPKIEIPVPEISPRLSDAPTTPKTSLLIQKDLRPDGKSMYQKILDSPKGEKCDIKITDTPRKDSERHDFENVGSPRIILKIAKSAITDCGEPRSPKSPKIRSAANSPNPEDSPGQKLGKIKLKLSKGGHPSIISNENLEDGVQRHSEGSMSLSPIGMKIKLSKTGDPSIVQPEKHDSLDDSKDVKPKFDDLSPKRTESPLGMKIKLSKTGEPSIVQDSGKETASKRKEKFEVAQENVKRSESSIGMKFKLSKSGDASIIQQETMEDTEFKEKFDISVDRPKRLDSPLGMKFKLSKSGDASIIPPEVSEDSSSKIREKSSADQENLKRTDSPLGMKIKLSKSGGASIIYPEKSEASDEFKEKSENLTEIKRVESPIGMKIKLSKSGDASIIHTERSDPHDENKDSILSKLRDRSDTQEMQTRTDSPLGMRIKVAKTGEASVIPSEEFKDPQSADANSEVSPQTPKRNDSPFGMKIKLSKSGDASIIHSERQEFPEDSKTGTISLVEGCKSSESPLGIKFKLSKSGDASIIHPEISPDLMDSSSKRSERQHDDTRRIESSFGMKIKLSKTGNPSIIESEKKEKSADAKSREKLISSQSDTSQKRKEGDFPLEMKIKFSKTRHPTIITTEKHESASEMHTKSKDLADNAQVSLHKREDMPTDGHDSHLKIFKTGNSTIIQNSKSEVTIEPVKPGQHLGSSIDTSRIHDEVIISPVESRKSKLESKLVQMLPEVTIQPVKAGDVKQIVFDKKTSSISRQQMSVINQEISITQVTSSKAPDATMSEKLKEILNKNNLNSPANSDCEIIEQRPELIIVNENSNSSQDIMIIKEVVAPVQEIKVPRKRGRPKRSTLPTGPPLHQQLIPRDPLALDEVPGMSGVAGAVARRETDRPRRTCRNQKSYAPPKRGRGRGRGKRKMDRMDCAMSKVGRFDDPLTMTESSRANLMDPLQTTIVSELSTQSSELYKALQHGPTDRKRPSSQVSHLHGSPETYSKKLRMEPNTVPQFTPDFVEVIDKSVAVIEPIPAPTDPQPIKLSEMLHLSSSETPQKQESEPMLSSKSENQNEKVIVSDIMPTEPQNWLTPSTKQSENSTNKSETISMVQVLDEETRMSAESNSRSQTPARNVSVPAAETVINEESQGSVLSTATTESEKVKVKARRMEIQFDPDEGPFTVDKIAEYEWPLDKKGDTFMIQEQISQYLGVKSFKRKYPDLKRRMVEMEERNYLRENGLVSEAMCDMGLTAICSSEVLDVMCSDFPDQYEEYRKHMREKQAKEHSKKQKELTAAANAERNRIDLAEMAIQSALSWNVNFNKARKDSRKYSLDLQSFTIHVPKKQQKVDSERKTSNYPVALIPGQYTDYYREYTPAELRYYPLNTVLYGPMRPNERKFDSQSEGSQSDSDSDSSSDDSSSSSSEGTQDTEESQSTIDEDMEIATHKEENKNLKCKMCLKHLNKHGKTEVLIQCGTCNGNVHPSCIDLTLDMVPHIQAYAWQCTDCKNCVLCHDPADEDKMLFCDMCDRGYHIYCVGLRRVPQGRWHCRECAVCASCGLRQPGGANSDRNSVAQWQHEYKKGEKNTRVYVSTLCVPCSKLWRKGRYCPYCSRCHSAQRLDLEANLVHCGACDKYLHLGCAEIKNMPINRKNYICEFCNTASQQQSSKASISKPIQL